MAKAIMPTLNSGAPVLTNYQEITANLVQFFLLNPGDLSSCIENEYVSFRMMAAKYQDNPDTLCLYVSQGLKNVVARYFPTFTDYIVDVTYSRYDDNDYEPRYILSIDITYVDAKGNTIAGISDKDFIIESDGRISVTYNDTPTDTSINEDIYNG